MLTPPYVPPVLFDIDSYRSVSHAPTVPLRVPLRRRRFSLAVVAVVALVSFVVTGLAVYESVVWLVEGMQERAVRS